MISGVRQDSGGYTEDVNIHCYVINEQNQALDQQGKINVQKMMDDWVDFENTENSMDEDGNHKNEAEASLEVFTSKEVFLTTLKDLQLPFNSAAYQAAKKEIENGAK